MKRVGGTRRDTASGRVYVFTREGSGMELQSCILGVEKNKKKKNKEKPSFLFIFLCSGWGRRSLKLRRLGDWTYYRVSGGPMMVIAHSKTLESSTSPAENPSMGFLLSSVNVRGKRKRRCYGKTVVSVTVDGKAYVGCVRGRHSE